MSEGIKNSFSFKSIGKMESKYLLTVLLFFLSCVSLMVSVFVDVTLLGRMFLLFVMLSLFFNSFINRHVISAPKGLSLISDILIVMFFLSIVFWFIVFLFDVRSITRPLGVISGDSMSPTLNEGDILLFGNPVNLERGDIIVYDIPRDNGRSYGGYYCSNNQLGRVLGFPEEHLTITTNSVTINGNEIIERYVRSSTNISFTGTFTVPLKEVFVASDDREMPCNSASIGTIPLNYIVSKVLSYYSQEQRGLFVFQNIIICLSISLFLTLIIMFRNKTEYEGSNLYFFGFSCFFLIMLLYSGVEYSVHEGHWYVYASIYYGISNFISLVFFDSPLALLTNLVLLIIGLVASVIEIRNFIENRRDSKKEES